MRGSLADRIADKCIPEPNSGCWLWTAYINDDGYGRIRSSNNKLMGAHRASYEIHRGSIPAGLQVLHTCDTPSCVNPDHLFVGTVQDNMDDMVAKGRGNSRRGIEHHKAKLSENDIRVIRLRINLGEKNREIAKSFGVTRGLIGMIGRGEIWRSVA